MKKRKGEIMKQKIFLTSALAMGFVAPAMAEPSHTGTFPSDGYMEEDYTYTNAATSDNMDGVYSGTVNAVAEYDVINYIVNAGQYLPADSETVITCPAGSYCPGIDGNVQYNQTTPQGIQTCPTGYASSAAGASSDTQCYRQCSGNVTIEHATGVTGNDYYGNGTDTCEPTDCVNGWHLKAHTLLDDYTEANPTNSSWGALNNNVFKYSNSGVNNQAYYGLENADIDSWGLTFENFGIVNGVGFCSSSESENGQHIMSDNISNETGSHCWCKITGYTPVGEERINVSSSWMYDAPYACGNNGHGECAEHCAAMFVVLGDTSERLRINMFDSIVIGLATCEANTITINWNDVDPEYAGQNNEGTATYGSDIRTPFKAATKKGQTFRGWRFSKPEQTDLP